MDKHQLDVIANDEAEIRSPLRRLAVWAKLIWYFFSRPLMNFILKRKLLNLDPRLKDDSVFCRVNMFLNNDGGMFKEHVYGMCENFRSIKDSRVLVPGIGYCKNLLQLAARKPKEIVAFDLYEYPEIWSMMTKKIMNEFGVPVTFYKGDFDALPAEKIGKFDFIISDAVLEHVPDMSKFASGSKKFLDQKGVFYASFGPLWYGPGGDHADWGPDKIFDHILLSKDDYVLQLENNPPNITDQDSCDTGFMIKTGLFSYLKAKQYIQDMEGAGFEIFDLRSKVPSSALRLLSKHQEISAALDKGEFPLFDRYSGGMYIWARIK